VAVEVPCLPETPVIGQIVISKAGRDAGKPFLVTRVIDETTVEVVDGDLRPVRRPKKKNIRHLEITSIVQENIRGEVSTGTLTDARVKETLSACHEDHFGHEEEGAF
jgi:large subunit ribosomal protein L14e